MAYTGGISFKGDKKQLHKAVPEALKLANMVSAMKSSAGLDSFEKVYDIPGGTVRVVDNSYTKHLYINVPLVPKVQTEEEKLQELFKGGVYCIRPVNDKLLPILTDVPPPIKAALTPRAVALTLVDDVIVIIEDELLKSEYGFKTFPNGTAAAAVVDWTSADGKQYLYSPISDPTAAEDIDDRELYYTSKYNQRELTKPSGVYHRNNNLFTSVVQGFGVFNGWIIYAVAGTGYLSTIMRALPLMEDEFGVLDLLDNTPTQLGTYGMAPTDYGSPSDFLISETLGSLFLNFSPTGDRATRARVFTKTSGTGLVRTTTPGPPASGTYVEYSETQTEYHSYMDEFEFEMDETVSPPVPKVKTHTRLPGGNITLTARHDANGTLMSNAQWLPLHFTKSNTTYTNSGTSLLVASDYSVAGSLAKLTLQLNEYSSIYDSYHGETRQDPDEDPSVSGLQSHVYFGDPLSDLYVPNFGNPPPVDAVEGGRYADDAYGEFNQTTESHKVNATLNYEADGTAHTLPFYSNSYEYSYDRNEDHTADYRQDWQGTIVPLPANPTTLYDGLGHEYQSHRIESTTTTTSTDTDSHTIITSKDVTHTGVCPYREYTGFDLSSIMGMYCCIDLRHGIFVSSAMEAEGTWNGNLNTSGSTSTNSYVHEYTLTNGTFFVPDYGPIYLRNESNTTNTGDYIQTNQYDQTLQESFTRVDRLYVFNKDVPIVNGLTLPQIEGINTPARPTYTRSHSSETNSHIPLQISFAPDIDTDDLGGSGANGSAVRGLGGSLAVDPGKSCLFSVFGSDFTDRGYAQQCKQATYLYNFETAKLHVLTPILWDSKQLAKVAPDLNLDRAVWGQVGCMEYVGPANEILA